MSKITKILYFDCISGISGDMALGAMIDLGVGLEVIEEGLKGLALEGYSLSLSREKRSGIEGARLSVALEALGVERSYADIRELINGSALSEEVCELSLNLFAIIAEAEGKVHGVPCDEVRFHEIGAVDSIIDIVGCAIAVKALGVDAIYSSTIPLGTGFVDTAHGVMPVPAPATALILKGVEIEPSTIKAELTTPTGAAIIKALSKGFGPMPAMTISEIGYGVGSAVFEERANLLRLFVGQSANESLSGPEVVLIETNIDDLSPQVSAYVMERLFRAGALDVWFTPVQMKKSRPGLLLTVIADEEKRSAMMEIIFTESTSIGVRFQRMERVALERKVSTKETRFGNIHIKVSSLDGRVVNRQPEFEELKSAAIKFSLPLKRVRDEVMALLIDDCADDIGE